MNTVYKKLIFYVLFIFAVIIGRFIWYSIDILPWNNTIMHLADSLIVASITLFLIVAVNAYVHSSKLQRVIRNSLLALSAIVIFFIFKDQLIALGISLGIIAAVLTLIFQNTILSAVGWVYITTGRIYSKGDRIRLGEIKGDIVGIDFLKTTVLEVGGEYVSSDVTSGRVYVFPNSILLSQPVTNYTRDLSFIWVDIPFQLSYESDFDFLMDQAEIITQKHIGSYLKKFNKEFKNLKTEYGLRRDPDKPFYFNFSPNLSWIDFRLTFPVDPHKQSGITTAVTLDILALFNQYPDKLGFPEGRRR